MTIGRPGRPRLFQGLRSRTLVLLFAIVAPIFALAFVWAMNRDLALRRFQFYAAQTATVLASERIGHLTQEADDLAALAPPDDGGACRVAPDFLARHPDFDAGFLEIGRAHV